MISPPHCRRDLQQSEHDMPFTYIGCLFVKAQRPSKTFIRRRGMINDRTKNPSKIQWISYFEDSAIRESTGAAANRNSSESEVAMTIEHSHTCPSRFPNCTEYNGIQPHLCCSNTGGQIAYPAVIQKSLSYRRRANLLKN